MLILLYQLIFSESGTGDKIDAKIERAGKSSQKCCGEAVEYRGGH